jgi:hypothetical protein
MKKCTKKEMNTGYRSKESKEIEKQKKIKIWILERVKEVQRIGEGYERN